LFSTSVEESAKFRAAFGNRLSFTKILHEQVKVWVAANIDRWKVDKPDWFKIEKIPDELLPEIVLEAEGGHHRKRSTASIRKMIGGIGSAVDAQQSRRVQPQEQQQ